MKKKTIRTLIIIFIVLVFIIPYVGVIYYTLPRNDEFASAYGVLKEGGYSMSSILRCVYTNYYGWMGNYSGVFFYSAFNPILIGNSDSTVRIMNLLCFAAFILGWSYIIYRCLSFFDIEESNKKFLTLIILVISMNCRFMRETLGWFTGYMYYTIQLMLGLIGLFLVYDLCSSDKEKTNKRRDTFVLVLACVFELIGAGGTLHVSSILCFCIFLLLIWSFCRKKSLVKSTILFVGICIPTLINALAPGHKIRKINYEAISIFRGIIYTTSCVYNEIKRICTNTYIPYILLVVFIILFFVIRTARPVLELHPAIIGPAGILCIWGSTFPVCYGYGEADIASRGYETMDLLIVLWAVMFLCGTVNYLKAKDIMMSKDMILVVSVFAIMLISTVAIDNVEISSIPSVQCISGLSDGSIKDYSDYWREILHQVENSKEKDLVIPVEGKYLECESIIDRVMIQEDETNWTNEAMAGFYGHNTVKIQRID